MSRAKNTGDILSEIGDIEGILENYNVEIFIDNLPWEANDILLWENVFSSWAIVYGVVDADTNMFVSTGSHNNYGKYHIWYRNISSSELISLRADPWNIYNFSVFEDKIFTSVYIRGFQAENYNWWEIVTTKLQIIDEFKPNLIGTDWWDIPENNHIFYNSIY